MNECVHLSRIGLNLSVRLLYSIDGVIDEKRGAGMSVKAQTATTLFSLVASPGECQDTDWSSVLHDFK